ncbi:MAG TPA: glycoside hydrolase family 140 protein [Fimbriimonas sp.]|nr:glycoside hydrolase family 140 protein [Fimbriimonas sp.]
MKALKVSDNRRFLTSDDGKPFFYLADTAWEMFHRLSLDEADHFLTTRARQGFNVIQSVVLAEFEGLTVPNKNGDLPLKDQDPTRPNESYFRHVDRLIDLANTKGLYVALLPTWGDKVNKKWGGGPEVFNPENARKYGEFLGKRYKDRGIIWVLGGDRPVETEAHLAIWRAMAAGITAGDGGKHLKTYHPAGGSSSSAKLHDERWLDFNMIQSGHGEKVALNYNMIGADYVRDPVKPVLDGEANYEDHPVAWKPEELGWFDERDVRRASYWSVFAGGCGITYGCHDVWQMWEPGREAVAWARTPWRTAIELPGAGQLAHLKNLMLSMPYLTRIPDPSLINGINPEGPRHMQSTRDTDGSYALIYTPIQQSIEVNLTRLAGETIRAEWFDPISGKVRKEGSHAKPSARFLPPADQDWVLVLRS